MGIYNIGSLLRERSFKKIKMTKLSLHLLLVVMGLMIGYSSAIYGEEPICRDDPSPLGGSDRIIQACKLPTDSIVPESKILEIKKKIQDGEIKMEPGAVGKFLDSLRRSDDHVSKAWCCKTPRNYSTIREPYAASRVYHICVPSGVWNNGCPEKRIVCCAGYIYRSASTNCLIWDEYAHLIAIQMRYCHV